MSKRIAIGRNERLAFNHVYMCGAEGEEVEGRPFPLRGRKI
jgi:hypothetical protein